VYDFLFVIIELFSLSLKPISHHRLRPDKTVLSGRSGWCEMGFTVDALQSKTCQNSLHFWEGGSVWAKISGEGVVPGEYFFGFYKTRHILPSDNANRTVLRAVVLTQYRRVIDRRTEQTDR